MGSSKINAGGNPVMEWHPIQAEVEILLVASCYRNQDKLRPDEPLSSYADLTCVQRTKRKSTKTITDNAFHVKQVRLPKY